MEKLLDKRTRVINAFIRQNGYKSYLEIGVHNGVNLSRIVCPVKVGVDPDPKSKATIHCTSDAYFAANPDARFDIVFVDGLHHADQVQRDIEHSLAALNPGGVILCHDMLPSNEAMQRVPRIQVAWVGDCWRAFVRLRARSDLVMYTIQHCTGIAVIYPGSQIPLVVPEELLTFQHFMRNKQSWMNVVPLARVNYVVPNNSAK